MRKKNFDKRIRDAWAKTPAEVRVEELESLEGMPDAEMTENQICIGVIRHKHGDDLVVGTSAGQTVFSFGKQVENLTDQELDLCGAIPLENNPRMQCQTCGHFSTHINAGLGMCRSCAYKFFAIRGYSFGAPVDGNTRRSAI